MRVEIFSSGAYSEKRWYVRVVGRNNEKLWVTQGFVSKSNAKRHSKRFYADLPIFEVEG